MKNLTDLNKIKRKFNALNAKLKDVKLAYQCFLTNDRATFCVNDGDVVEDIKTASGGDLARDFEEVHNNFKTLATDLYLKKSIHKFFYVEILIYDKNTEILDYLDETLGCFCNRNDEILTNEDEIVISDFDKEIIKQIAKLFN